MALAEIKQLLLVIKLPPPPPLGPITLKAVSRQPRTQIFDMQHHINPTRRYMKEGLNFLKMEDDFNLFKWKTIIYYFRKFIYFSFYGRQPHFSENERRPFFGNGNGIGLQKN